MKPCMPAVSLFALVALSACGGGGEAASPTKQAPASATDTSNGKTKSILNWFFPQDDYLFTTGYLNDVTNIGPPNSIQSSGGLWQGIMVISRDECSPGSLGYEVPRLLFVTTEGEENISVVDEQGRVYAGKSDQFISFDAPLSFDFDTVGQTGGDVSFLWSGGPATVTIREEYPTANGFCVNEYFGGMSRIPAVASSEEQPE